MLKIASFVGTMVLFAAFPAWTQVHDPVLPPGTILKERKPANVACDCCKQCMAARKHVTPGKQGSPATGGCGDCCEKCGKVHRPLKNTTPPDIIIEHQTK